MFLTEQFATFMGHTKKTHEEYYRLPQDVFQTAKVSKVLLAVNRGKGNKYKGMNLEEVDLSNDTDSGEQQDMNSDKSRSRSTTTVKSVAVTSRSPPTTRTSDEDEDASRKEIKTAKRKLKQKPGGAKSTITSAKSRSPPTTGTSDDDKQSIKSLRKKIKTDKRNQKQKSRGGAKNTLTSAKSRWSSSTDASSEEEEQTSQKTKIIRQRWTEKQKHLIKTHFNGHIKNKIPPKKTEVEEFLNKHKAIFVGRNWVVVKAFVYNVYSKS